MAAPLTPQQDLSAALAVLSAMITPAVLILGSSSLVAATSTRLGRLLDRARRLAEQLEQLLAQPPAAAGPGGKCELLIELLRKTARRTVLLQRAMTVLYAALGTFVATSIALGVDAALGTGHIVLLVGLSLVGALLLLYSTLLLVAESRIAVSAVQREMNYALRLANRDCHPSSTTPRA